MKDKKAIFIIVLILVLILLILIYIFGNKNINSSNNTTNSVSIVNDEESIDSNDEYSEWKSASNIVLNGDSATGTGISITGTTIKITNAGNYHITGTLNDGTIIIDSTGVVRLILDNASITSSNTAAINVKNAKKVIISLVDGTTNTITDSSNYVYDDVSKEEPDGAIFSKDDLTINGTGTLNVYANFKDGIVCKDSLKIMSGIINIKSVGDGIRGKDCVIIKNGTFTIDAQNDGIKSTNDSDTSLGYIIIDNGTFTITSQEDGFQAETSLVINDGTFNITTGAGSGSVAETINTFNGNNIQNTTSDTTSRKGMKAKTGIKILAGKFNINSEDDSIHSNSDILIENGTFELSSGDDGMHADSKLTINNGTIDIAKSYEGIEGLEIEINNGKINVKASDDGMNAAGGNDSSSINGRPGQNNFSSTTDTNVKITINDGEIYVNAAGDGIDSNGSVYINGGEITVDGPTDNGNGSLDYNNELKMTGGTLIAAGSSGMMQSISDSSTTYCISTAFSTTQIAGSTVTVKDSAGNEVIKYSPSKQYQSIVIATTKLEKGGTYTVYVDSVEISTVTLSNIVTSIGTTTGNGGGMMNNMGGGQKNQNR